uniref:Proteasome 26S subunit, non-ATPase 2 n=1 Tax=Sinocyclocheilus rhinocerous TaxID=307959 RepID=A0A673NNX9_9TELE
KLDIMEPKVPDDIYKTHLENNRFGSSGSQVDSARMNLASSFVNGFVNAAFGQDKLLTEDGNKWLYKNKDHGMLSAAASLGMILLWDVDGGLTQIDKYLYSSEDYIKVQIHILNSVLTSKALYLVSDESVCVSVCLMSPCVFVQVAGVTALACGMIAVGSCNGDVTSTILQTIMEKSEQELKDTFARWLPLGLGLNHLGKGETIETTLAALQVVPEPFRSFSNTLVDVCAYAGSGNVLKLRYGEPTLRRAVPLALALISVSNPRLNILDTLSKFSHDADPEVAHNAIFAMGMVGSGTNNARLAAMLRQLAQYHAKDPNNLFMVRLAQVRLHVSQQHFRSCDSLSFLFVAAVVSTVNERWDLRHINTHSSKRQRRYVYHLYIHLKIRRKK